MRTQAVNVPEFIGKTHLSYWGFCGSQRRRLPGNGDLQYDLGCPAAAEIPHMSSCPGALREGWRY
jgi:hypothetical protein